jgi:transposase
MSDLSRKETIIFLEATMSKFRGVNRNQLFLLPPSIEDFVPEGHMARLVDEVVESLCTHEIEEKYSHLGRKAYEPKMLIKILFYGYSTGDRSSRKLARKCEMDLAYLYLGGMERPDFRTISDFRKNNLEALKGYFRDIVLFCRGAGLGRGQAVFIDGTKIRANAAAKRTKKKLRKFSVRLRMLTRLRTESMGRDEEMNCLLNYRRPLIAAAVLRKQRSVWRRTA